MLIDDYSTLLVSIYINPYAKKKKRKKKKKLRENNHTKNVHMHVKIS